MVQNIVKGIVGAACGAAVATLSYSMFSDANNQNKLHKQRMQILENEYEEKKKLLESKNK